MRKCLTGLLVGLMFTLAGAAGCDEQPASPTAIKKEVFSPIVGRVSDPGECQIFCRFRR